MLASTGWYRLEQDSAGCCSLVLVGTDWYWLVPAGTGWYRLVQAGKGWYRLVQNVKGC